MTKVISQLVFARDLPDSSGTPPREVHVAHKAVVETVKAMRARFPKISADGMAKHTAGAVAAMFMERIEALEKRIVDLESRPTPKYVGAFKQGQVCKPGHFVTHQGSLWHCNFPTMQPPGKIQGEFTLAVKRGVRWKGRAMRRSWKQALSCLREQSLERGLRGRLADFDIQLCEDKRTVSVWAFYELDPPLMASFELPAAIDPHEFDAAAFTQKRSALPLFL